MQTGTHGVLEHVKGKYFYGSDKSIPTSGLFFPAAGYRNGSGGPNEREVSGNYWSSSVDEEDAYRLVFTGTLTYTGSCSRYMAYSVRCVQE